MSNTDRELLEWAAKAAGVEYRFNDSTCLKGPNYIRCATGYQEWNPLTDDGDALRLAVKLGFMVNTSGLITCTGLLGVTDLHIVEHGIDPYAATRRAIVRAAAEISKAMSHAG